MSGKRVVLTQTSTYLIDEDEGWIQRIPGDPNTVTENGYLAVTLRKDLARIPLIRIEGEIVVGESAVFWLQIRDDGVQTFRRTTPVKEIIDVGADEPQTGGPQ